jgi:hypothetical protein
MHLAQPGRALAEMTRVVRPGGRVIAIEPDFVLARLSQAHRFVDESSEGTLRHAERLLRLAEARKQAGCGDFRVGRRLPELLLEAGLTEIHMRMADGVYQLLPPYDPKEPGTYAHWLLGHFPLQGQSNGTESWMADQPNAAELLGLSKALHAERVALNEAKAEAIKRGELTMTSFNHLYVAVGRKPT